MANIVLSGITLHCIASNQIKPRDTEQDELLGNTSDPRTQIEYYTRDNSEDDLDLPRHHNDYDQDTDANDYDPSVEIFC